MCNFGRGDCGEYPYEIILNLGEEEMFKEKAKQNVRQMPDEDQSQ